MTPAEAEADTRAATILSFLQLSRIIALDYSHPFLHHDDLAQDGMVAVCAAVDNFDASRGIPLKRWVALCIRLACKAAIRNAIQADLGRVDWDVADTLDADSAELSDLIDLDGAVSDLPEPDRSILVSKFGLDGTAPKYRCQMARRAGELARVSNSLKRSIQALRLKLSV